MLFLLSLSFWHGRNLIDNILEIVNNHVKLLESIIEGNWNLIAS